MQASVSAHAHKTNISCNNNKLLVPTIWSQSCEFFSFTLFYQEQNDYTNQNQISFQKYSNIQEIKLIAKEGPR